MVEKSTSIKRETDVYYDLVNGSAKYRTMVDELNKFVEKEQI